MLFDLNGVLMLREFVTRGTHRIKVRPGLELLQRLVDEGCQLGIFTSCMRGTVVKSLGEIHAFLRSRDASSSAPRGDGVGSPSQGDGWVFAVTAGTKLHPAEGPRTGVAPAGRVSEPPAGPGDAVVSDPSADAKTRCGPEPAAGAKTRPGPPSELVFSPVLDRSHCAPRENGPTPWATFKPLGRYVSNVRWVVLVDDNDEKVVPEERDRALIVPTWAGAEQDRADKTFVAMVDGLVEAVRASRQKAQEAADPTGAVTALDLAPARAALAAAKGG